MIDGYRRLFKRLAGAPIGRNPSRSALFSSFLQEPKMRTKTRHQKGPCKCVKWEQTKKPTQNQIWRRDSSFTQRRGLVNRSVYNQIFFFFVLFDSRRERNNWKINIFYLFYFFKIKNANTISSVHLDPCKFGDVWVWELLLLSTSYKYFLTCRWRRCLVFHKLPVNYGVWREWRKKESEWIR